VVLPFTGLDRPTGVAVDTAGAVYVTDSGNNRVVKLAADSPTQTVPAITGLSNPVGIAMDNGGNLYVTDANNGRVLWADAPRSAASPPWQAASSIVWVGPLQACRRPTA
jgi:DNA-binding beta-propeller fold protein YncE